MGDILGALKYVSRQVLPALGLAMESCEERENIKENLQNYRMADKKTTENIFLACQHSALVYTGNEEIIRHSLRHNIKNSSGEVVPHELISFKAGTVPMYKIDYKHDPSEHHDCIGQWYIAKRESSGYQEIYLFFRGTASSADIFSDLLIAPKVSGNIAIHGGVAEILMNDNVLRETLTSLNLVSTSKDEWITTDIFLGGHSLGGALAMGVMALDILKPASPTFRYHIYTFGAPAIFWSVFGKTSDIANSPHIYIHQCINDLDIIPRFLGQDNYFLFTNTMSLLTGRKTDFSERVVGYAKHYRHLTHDRSIFFLIIAGLFLQIKGGEMKSFLNLHHALLNLKRSSSDHHLLSYFLSIGQQFTISKLALEAHYSVLQKPFTVCIKRFEKSKPARHKTKKHSGSSKNTTRR